jgi:peptide/nickel transport system permease protein
MPTGRIGLALSAIVLAIAILGPLVLPHAPNAIDVPARLQPPGLNHFLGTDHLGRDILARVAAGLRIAIVISLAVVALALAVGAVLGTTAAMLGGVVDRVIVMIFDTISAFPAVILALAVIALYGSQMTSLIGLVAAVFIPHFGRIARAQTLVLREAPFISAERLLGLSVPLIILRHVVPNTIGPLLVVASMDVPVVITIEAGLSFLGLGVPPPTPSLGSLLRDGYIYLQQSPWPAIVSAGALALLTLSSTLLGEAVRDAVDPRLQIR